MKTDFVFVREALRLVLKAAIPISSACLPPGSCNGKKKKGLAGDQTFSGHNAP
jgi:hypothetical protein